MAVFSLSSLLSSFLLISAPILVSGAPAAHFARQEEDYTWPQCMPVGLGSCTLYMATADPDMDDYRTAVLFDNNCNPLQAIMDNKNNPKLTLKGSLPNYVDLFVDSNIHPVGYVSYLGNDYELGETMACYKPPNSDGVGCRKAFRCS